MLDADVSSERSFRRQPFSEGVRNRFASAGAVLATVLFSHHRILRDGSKEPLDVG
jgi:hypothetical protein